MLHYQRSDFLHGDGFLELDGGGRGQAEGN